MFLNCIKRPKKAVQFLYKHDKKIRLTGFSPTTYTKQLVFLESHSKATQQRTVRCETLRIEEIYCKISHSLTWLSRLFVNMFINLTDFLNRMFMSLGTIHTNLTEPKLHFRLGRRRVLYFCSTHSRQHFHLHYKMNCFLKYSRSNKNRLGIIQKLQFEYLTKSRRIILFI